MNEAAVKWLEDNGIDYRRGVYAEDVDFFGLEFYGERLHVETYWKELYYSDKYIDEIRKDDEYAFEDGSSKDIPYEQMIGKRLVCTHQVGNQTKYIYNTIKGIYKALDVGFDEDWDGHTDLGRYLDSRILNMGTITSRRERTPLTALSSKNDVYNIFKLTIAGKTVTMKEGDPFKLAQQSINDVTSTYDIFGENGHEHYTERLADDEIILTADMYSTLFEEHIEPFSFDKWQDYEDYVEQFKDFVPKHLGETIDFEYIRTDVNETLLSLKGKKIIGVTTDYDSSIYVAPNMISDNLSENYYKYSSGDEIYIKVTEYSRLKDTLKTLRKEYNVGVNVLTEDGEIYFYFEEHAGAGSSIIWTILICISSALCLILMIGMVSLGITARKKEIGIFKALGCKNSDVKLIFLLEVLLIGIIAAALSIILTNIFTNCYFNPDLISNIPHITGGITLVMMDPVSYLIIFGAAFVMTWLVSYLPLIKISRMKPVDAIKNL